MIQRPSSAGFTLIEMMIVIAIMAILSAVAFPAFQAFIAANRLTAESNELLAGLNLARSESVRVQRRVVLCRAAASNGVVTFSAGSACVTTADSNPWQAWGVFVDEDSSGDLNGSERVVRVQAINGSSIRVVSDSTLATAGNRIVFRPDGMARGAGSLALQTAQIRVCDNSGAITGENVRIVSLSSGSRMSVSRATDASCGNGS